MRKRKQGREGGGGLGSRDGWRRRVGGEDKVEARDKLGLRLGLGCLMGFLSNFRTIILKFSFFLEIVDVYGKKYLHI